ncbi:hypothetical protein JCM10914A_51310 [Paenibacillus sp. JCM 10914]|uniref:DUF6933 domain-containing protein n=1 Tax=Paenibacillus sp. JCM 10914 TaxID=1236974 RepID=UPI00055CE205|nr:hypothetical protein [Paenibacillus sp. JCM 10914]
MLALRFTQKLIKDMKVAPEELAEDNQIFSWHVNILQLRRKHIIFVNDASRLCLVIDGIRSSQVDKLQEKFRTVLREYLLFEGFKKNMIDQYFLEAGEINIGKTNSKSVIGTMSEMTFYSSHKEFDHPYELISWLNSIILKPIGYEKPIHVFQRELTSKYQ